MNIIKYLGQGIFHNDNYLECQDSLGYLVTESGRVILALSDGCGSCIHAKSASETVVDTILEYYSDNTNSLANDINAKKQLIKMINDRLLQKALKLSYKDTYEFSATMVFAVIEDCYVLIGHIGDGALMCYGKNGELLFESVAENGVDEYETYFVNSYDALRRFRLDILELEEKSLLRNIVMYSDGPEKMFNSHIRKGLNEGATSLVSNVRNNNITDCAQLGEYLHSIFTDSAKNATDDWSLIVFDREQNMCNDFNPEPVVMSSVYAERTSDRYKDFSSVSYLASPVSAEEEKNEISYSAADIDETNDSESVKENPDGDTLDVYQENSNKDESCQREAEQISFIEKNIDELYVDFEDPAYNHSEINDLDYPEIEPDFLGKNGQYPESVFDDVKLSDDMSANTDAHRTENFEKNEQPTAGRIKNYIKKITKGLW